MKPAARIRTIFSAAALSYAALSPRAMAEPGQPLPTPPEGLSGQGSVFWGVRATPVETARKFFRDTKENVMDSADKARDSVMSDMEDREADKVKDLKNIGPGDILKDPGLIDTTPRGPDDVMKARLTLRMGAWVFGGGAGREKGGVFPTEASVSYIERGKNDATGLTLTLGLLDNVHRTALSGFRIKEQPLTLLADKDFSDRMTLSDHAGARFSGRMPLEDSGALFLRYDGTLTARVSDRFNAAGYSPIPGGTADVAFEISASRNWNASVGSGAVRLPMPDGGALEAATTTAMLKWGDNAEASIAAMTELTRLSAPGTPLRDHFVFGAVTAGEAGKILRLHTAGAYVVDKDHSDPSSAPTRTITGEIGACVGPTLLSLCGDAGGGTVRSDDARKEIKIVMQARGGFRAAF